METVSVIIPTLNESKSLPVLLTALQRQTRPPDEIIIADAGSTDRTAEIAVEMGARVVPGGRPSRGRNAGASAAAGSLLLFLDADVLPAADFIERFIGGFVYNQLAVATCGIAPIEDNYRDQLLCDATNMYMELVQYVSPHAPGFCILIKRHIHFEIGGFDESAVMAEDHDYVQRASDAGPFGVLPQVEIPVSFRRLEKEGVVRLAIKYLYCELHALTGRPVRSMPFVYEFGNYTGPQAPRFVDIGWLRKQLDRVENPLNRLSKPSLNAMKKLAGFSLSTDRFEQALEHLLPEDLHLLNDYLSKRLSLLQMRSRSFWKNTVQRLQESLPGFEGVRLLESGDEMKDELTIDGQGDDDELL